MRIAFLVERATQFEVPFYRYAARDPDHSLRVIFTGQAPVATLYDPELSRQVDWGFDLLDGYESVSAPAKDIATFLRRELAPGAFDLAIVNGYTKSPYLTGALAARRSGIATGLRVDSVRFSGQSRGIKGWLKTQIFNQGLSRLFDVFLPVGSLTLSYLKEMVPTGRYALFPYAVDIDEFNRKASQSRPQRDETKAALGIPLGATVILSLAKFSKRETPWDLIKAFSKLCGPSREEWLVLAGDGPDRQGIEAEARSLGLNRVRFPGYWPYARLAELYTAADLFVHPAAEERWGVSVQEALACGLPVVASTRVGAAYDLIQPGRNGYLYQAGDAEDLAGRISNALALPKADVHRATLEISPKWDYSATWKNLIDTAKGARDWKKT